MGRVQANNFDFGVLFFQITETTATLDVASDQTGTLFKGTGERVDQKRVNNLPVQNAQFFISFNHLDLIHGTNYRVMQSHKHGDDYLTTKFRTWDDTSIWRVQDAVLYTPYN
eukprot:CAMPEP_0114596368 /NCGR_PEP_ID=MMETSP0125-20121206/18355_1 /TAXON_ID=485358 ORGANISM="Aristerostoma sp., Strain ATCC 50986" /NCGR_SAMPLE_ID=MMETSP0125 /ASSEMBLY_ACC=CAM_ASM_000245 /LENGTH=111 /DNA_ID=CAMNT_0001799263 /DNA_START=615 /DNA_END=950 /DNA_ORIENTATION=-